MSFEIKFSYLKCVVYLSLVPILKSSRRCLAKLLETATLPSFRRKSIGYLKPLLFLLLEGRVAVSNNFAKQRLRRLRSTYEGEWI